jgi:hypothetical protein
LVLPNREAKKLILGDSTIKKFNNSSKKQKNQKKKKIPARIWHERMRRSRPMHRDWNSRKVFVEFTHAIEILKYMFSARIVVPAAVAMRDLGARIAAHCVPGDRVLLHGLVGRLGIGDFFILFFICVAHTPASVCKSRAID